MLLDILSWLRSVLKPLGLLHIIKRCLYVPSDCLTASTGKFHGLIYFIKALIEKANFDHSLIGEPDFIDEIQRINEPEMVV